MASKAKACPCGSKGKTCLCGFKGRGLPLWLQRRRPAPVAPKAKTCLCGSKSKDLPLWLQGPPLWLPRPRPVSVAQKVKVCLCGSKGHPCGSKGKGLPLWLQIPPCTRQRSGRRARTGTSHSYYCQGRLFPYGLNSFCSSRSIPELHAARLPGSRMGLLAQWDGWVVAFPKIPTD